MLDKSCEAGLVHLLLLKAEFIFNYYEHTTL